jgi:dTDP-4-amino-4,6-dideoxygalactose transaminase
MDANAWKRYSAEGTPFYTIAEPGFNYRMTDIHASLGLHQLRKLPDDNQRRRELARLYTRLLEDTPEVETPVIRPEVDSNWHLYVIRLNDTAASRDEICDRLKRLGIGNAVHYYPVHYHPYYRENFGFRRGDYPVAEREFERLISLPLHPLMSESDVERVVGAVRDTVGAR